MNWIVGLHSFIRGDLRDRTPPIAILTSEWKHFQEKFSRRPIQTSLDQFERFQRSLDKLRHLDTFISEFRQIWFISKEIWTTSVNFKQVWTNLDRFYANLETFLSNLKRLRPPKLDVWWLFPKFFRDNIIFGIYLGNEYLGVWPKNQGFFCRKNNQIHFPID